MPARVLCLLATLSLAETLTVGLPTRCVHVVSRTPAPVLAAKAKKKTAKAKKPSGGFGSSGAKSGGFGAAPVKKAKELSPEQQQWSSFMDWVTSSGGNIDAVRLANCGGGLRGLKATRDLARGEEIIRIPRGIMLDVARAEASAVSGIWRPHEQPLPGYAKIALALLYELRRGADSDLAPYIEMLPTADGFAADGGPAALWSDEELAVTECGKLVDAAKRRREQSYGDGHPALQPTALQDSWRQLELPGTPPSGDEISWAVTAVTSRAYGVGTPAPGQPPESGLVPVVDMANHDGRDPQHTAKGLEEDGNSFVVLATEPIKRNAQVCLSYGSLANFNLLPQFGFVLPELGSPPDLALVDCSAVVTTARKTEAGADTLEGLADDGLLMRDGDGTVSCWQAAGKRLQAALLRLAEQDALPAPEGESDEETAATPTDRALESYCELLQATLDGFSTTVAQDRAALGLTNDGAAAGGEAPLPPRTRLAMQFRLSQKTLLNQALASAVKRGAPGLAEAAAGLTFEVLGSKVYAAAAAAPAAIRTASGLIIEHIEDGDGATPKSTDTVEVHYEGKNADGIAFDSSYTRGDPIAFPVTGVIAGWTEGLQQMKVGGKAKLTIPPHLGYGDKGSPPRIPARATLVFTVELLAIK